MAEKFGQWLDTFYGHEVEPVVFVDESGGGENMNVGVKAKVVAEGLRGGDGGELSVGQIESEAHPVAETFDGNLKEMVKQFSSFSEDAAQGPGHGENELPMGNLETDAMSYPVPDLPDAALVATGAEVAGFAGECEKLLVAAVGAEDTGESGGEISAAAELVYDFERVGTEWAVDLSMAGFVVDDKIIPGVMDQLPEW